MSSDIRTRPELQFWFWCFDYCCAYCGKKSEPRRLTSDHVVPRSKGGGNGINNILPACSGCNSQKRNKSPHNFLRMKNNRNFEDRLRRALERADDPGQKAEFMATIRSAEQLELERRMLAEGSAVVWKEQKSG